MLAIPAERLRIESLPLAVWRTDKWLDPPIQIWQVSIEEKTEREPEERSISRPATFSKRPFHCMQDMSVVQKRGRVRGGKAQSRGAEKGV